MGESSREYSGEAECGREERVDEGIGGGGV